MNPGRVYLIGAGPGEPTLISVRGQRFLSEAGQQCVSFHRIAAVVLPEPPAALAMLAMLLAWALLWASAASASSAGFDPSRRSFFLIEGLLSTTQVVAIVLVALGAYILFTTSRNEPAPA